MVMRNEAMVKEGGCEAVCEQLSTGRDLFTGVAWRFIERTEIEGNLGAFIETNHENDYKMTEKYQLEFNREFLEQARSSYLQGEIRSS